ncbi:hypothetical protein A2V82_06450 [candidate division KSB1 bacterium RBG_16_48_16]|nr:MAG: hypothetical protein A2V82_06450 [candidate division KSB1 bacterium RBG_16_48_16]
MSTLNVPVVIHGVTGRMGQIAMAALQSIAQNRSAKIDGDIIKPIPIGVGRNSEKLARIAKQYGLENYFSAVEPAIQLGRRLNKEYMVYHCTISTGIRRQVMLDVWPFLDAGSTALFMEKPLAPNYADGYAIVKAIEQKGFYNGVVHDMLSTPGVRKAMELLPRIKPLHARMLFGYEVGAGLGGNKEYSGQRPDFNWRLEESGGGIILDMCHEGYLSKAFFGETEKLSSVARLLVPQRLSTDGKTIIDCNVEDYHALRRQHKNGAVNTSLWTWYRRVNSEFGPLEITIEGEGGTLVFGLYGLKVQWKETAPANRWERSVTGGKIQWRDFWQYEKIAYEDPFAFELVDFLQRYLRGEEYTMNAVHALDILGEVEAQYSSAAKDGVEIHCSDFLKYPKAVPGGWVAERLQGKLKGTSSS